MTHTPSAESRAGRSPVRRPLGAVLAATATLLAGTAGAETTLLNVSYDPTRELYREYNEAFNAHWQAQGHEPLAIGLWVGHLHPKFAIAARLSGDRAPIVADLALPFWPRLLVLAGQWGSQVVVVATGDLIAAELAGLVLRHGAVHDPDERPRPWEDPLIQRAAELGLGIEHPSSLDLRPIWAGAIGSLRKARASSTVTAPKAEDTTVANSGSGKLPAAVMVPNAATSRQPINAKTGSQRIGIGAPGERHR